MNEANDLTSREIAWEYRKLPGVILVFLIGGFINSLRVIHNYIFKPLFDLHLITPWSSSPRIGIIVGLGITILSIWYPIQPIQILFWAIVSSLGSFIVISFLARAACS